jgi:hypothetical protein
MAFDRLRLSGVEDLPHKPSPLRLSLSKPAHNTRTNTHG